MRTILLIFLALAPDLTYADACPTPYNKSLLPYPSRQKLCPNGSFFVDYITKKSHSCENGQVDHVIPTKLMYKLGVCGDRLKAFSADRDNLRMTFSKLNLEKSDKNPFLYATRHGEDAEAAVEGIVRKMSNKYPEVSVSRLRSEATRLKDAEIRMLYRQKNRALDMARLQQQARKKIQMRIASRMVKALGRNSTITTLESSTLFLAPLALAAIAWDINDTCNTIKDLKELDTTDNSLTDLGDEIALCGMNEDEILAFLGIDPKLNTCIVSRVSKNEMFPDECEGLEVNIPTYEGEEISVSPKPNVEIPSYD
ncbi:hypothetical protein N9Y41_04060 [Planktomarina temperata]|nr:hypothetical protein [Planktomarina temperata]